MNTDYIIIGSGIAGLNTALLTAKKGKVILITKSKLTKSSTELAQGGMAAVLDPKDNISNHVQDTLVAGAHHNKKKATTFLVSHSAEAIQRLLSLGVPFNKKNHALALTQEGGHHMRRIAYVHDYTGKAIEETLIQHVKKNKNITIYENTFALDLLVKNNTCWGVRISRKGKIENIYAPVTVLATGGVGQVYKLTTNPTVSTGDGIAMAYRAGAKIQDMEFVQFHPTAFAKGGNPKFLLSEAIRGEGALLRNAKKERFMEKYHPDAELAPRDIVARAIYEELKKGPVYLDISHVNTHEIQKRFPHISATLTKHGYDLTKDLIPIAPVAHFMCGGITTNLKGETTIKHLYAFGECTYTGVHGANRLASNSLLEGMVFSSHAPIKASSQSSPIPTFSISPKSTPKMNKKVIQQLRKQIQNTMWEYVGIIRTDTGLAQAQKLLKKIDAQLPSSTDTFIAETKNLITVAQLITNSARKRRNSLGCHWRR